MREFEIAGMTNLSEQETFQIDGGFIPLAIWGIAVAIELFITAPVVVTAASTAAWYFGAGVAAYTIYDVYFE